MRIIAVGDIHMASHCFAEIEAAAKADLLLLNGDLTQFGGREQARRVIEHARRAVPAVLAQFGNLDRPEVNDYLDEIGINLHGRAQIIDDQFCVVGIGGSNLTPFSTPSEFSEEELEAIATRGFARARSLLSKKKAQRDQAPSARANLQHPLEKNEIPLILVSHAPPHNCDLDRLADGSHVGSPAIRAAIERETPDLCICGHIHEAAGSDHVGSTPVYNPGMLENDGWLEIELNDGTLTVTLHNSLTR